MCILTLRYDPNSNSNYPKLDFNNTTKIKPEENYIDIVENSIQEVFDKELNKLEKIGDIISSITLDGTGKAKPMVVVGLKGLG